MGTSANSVNLKNGFPTPGPQTPTGQQVMNHVFFLSETEWKKAREEGDYDLVIIGTGFCAYAVAERALANDPLCKILMIERGPFFMPEHFQNLPLPFVNTLGGLSETFPWTLTSETVSEGTIRWQHGMVPFVGGRSTLWSSWCPRPNPREMEGWPEETVKAAEEYFYSAEALLHVQKADEVDSDCDDTKLKMISSKRPVYGALQQRVQTLLKDNMGQAQGVYRTEAAPLASGAEDVDGVDFQKFSIPGDLLALAVKQAGLKKKGQGAPLHIVTQCAVERILQQDGTATALETTKGVVPLGDAKLVLAMGTLPPATLVRNSFSQAKQVGQRFSAHFITAIAARVPKADLDPEGAFGDLELSACYVAGIGKDYEQQFHIQLTSLWDKEPYKNSGTALRYMPDVVATASMAQLESSKDHVVFVCAVLGELDYRNKKNWFLENTQDNNLTTNSLLQITENNKDAETWKAMDTATFDVLENILSPKGAERVEYWHGSPDDGNWSSERPSESERRVDALVHESSTMHIGNDECAPVDLDYKVKGTSNVYLTGGGLWPQGGSWNPTMTMVALSQHLADQLIKKSGKN